MTLDPTTCYYLYREHPMFSKWATDRGVLFLPKECAESEEDEDYKNWDLTSKVYVFMKRLGQDYNRVMQMDSDERDKLFEMEMKLVKEEHKAHNKSKHNSNGL